ncbi:MAG: glycosyl hydrolase 115 family protein [Clostridium sp.]|nr:glycosyl hydrolase 115 family protein [Clostridium sp.]
MSSWGAGIAWSETRQSSSDFSLAESSIFYSTSEPELVALAANMLKDDIKRVTGKKASCKPYGMPKGSNVVIVATLGNNPFVESLIASGSLNADSLKGAWERFIIKTVDKPAKGVEKALVILGSDRRGAAFGVASLSEEIGVSPFYWWADVPPVKHPGVFIPKTEYLSKSPTVKYRGIFINDEGWGFQPWASKTFEPEAGAPGPRTYEKVCELLIRLKANMLAPAMHPATVAFNKIPENKRAADRWGIIVTTSHCEPLHYNNTTEWDKESQGEWNYLTNKSGINSVLEQRVSEVAPYENVYVLAMRGIHDAGLVGVPEDQKVSVTEAALADQRRLLAKYIDKPIEEIPQVFVPYKEVLDIYEKGLYLPDDVTIVWPDDNFGYIKRLSDENERKRKGGSGVYYHISYLGEPHDYLWLNTTPSTLIYEEMRKAHLAGADRYWLLNVGDIKPGGLGIKLFMEMAWDIGKFDFDSAHDFAPTFLASIFGDEFYSDLSDIMETYYLEGFRRKPEAMGWGIEWNHAFSNERMTDTDFSFSNYEEAQNRLNEYDRISNMSQSIMDRLPMDKKDAFFQLVHYPVKGAALMNRKMLLAQLSREYARQNRAATASVAAKAQEAFDSLSLLTEEYNSLKDGKWRHFMQLAPGWTATYLHMPDTGEASLAEGPRINVYAPGQSGNFPCGLGGAIPCQSPYASETPYFEIYNSGNKPFEWNAVCNHPAVSLTASHGEVADQCRVGVNIDWSKADEGMSSAICVVSGCGKEITVIIPMLKPTARQLSDAKNCRIEQGGAVSIPAGKPSRIFANGDTELRTVKGLGYEKDCLLMGNPFSAFKPRGLRNRPKAEYDFYSFSAGNAHVKVHALPVFGLNKGFGTEYGIQIDDGIVIWQGAPSAEYSTRWKTNVIKNSEVSTAILNVAEPGKHKLTVYCSDPGIVLQKIIIDFGGEKHSYLGPPASPLIR